MIDLEAARTSLPAFCAQIGRPLTDAQAEALTLERHTTAIVASRQSGKSWSLTNLALWWAWRRAGQRVLVISAGEDAARRLLADVRRVATTAPLLRGSVVDETASLVRLSTGSEVRCVPASERQVRGWTVDLLLVDEAGLVGDDLLASAAVPTTAARRDARIVLAGSAGPASGVFYDTVRRGEAGSEHVAVYRWGLADAPWITPASIDAAREALSPLRFAAEYEGVFAGQADLLLPRRAIERVTVDVALPGLDGLAAGSARPYAGVDWGETCDRSALAAIVRCPEAGPRRFLVAEAFAWPSGHPLVGAGSVTDRIAGAHVPYGRLTAERNGLGEALCQELRRRLAERPPLVGGGIAPAVSGEDRLWRTVEVAEHYWFGHDAREHRHTGWEAERPVPTVGFSTAFRAVYTSGAMKAAVFAALRLLIEREALLIPSSCVELLRELSLLRVTLLPSGTDRIEASTGHDDLAMALGLALGPYQRAGRWRVRLADHADPSAPVPAPAPGAGTGESVSTPAGELPHRPLLQSIDGEHVTAPDHDGAPRGALDPHAAARERVAASLDRQRGHTP